ncbi:MAG: ImmA/IrrE family metallo-endopeptidase [Chloroflexota bacterium]|nr:MAG: ImmA/IrrE family metallo-endopeptidase [Chloroflexota bacterium]
MSGRKFYNEKMVESQAYDVLRRFYTQSKKQLTLPVPAERIAEDVIDLSILWEVIPEPPGQTILAGLASKDRLVVFNETRRPLFDDTPFLYNTVLAHEVGHWQLHVDEMSLYHPILPGFERPFQFVCRRGSDSWEERHAHWFASHLLLPRNLLAAYIAGLTIGSLADMYRLRDQLQVTITVLRIALEKIGAAYVDDSGAVHPSRQEFHGQFRLL